MPDLSPVQEAGEHRRKNKPFDFIRKTDIGNRFVRMLPGPGGGYGYAYYKSYVPYPEDWYFDLISDNDIKGSTS